jgi:hypothetical protein
VNRETGLLDTNVVAALPTTDLAGSLPSYTFITTITLAELAAGPLATDDPVEQDRRLAVFQGVASTYPHSTCSRHSPTPTFTPPSARSVVSPEAAKLTSASPR